MSKQKQENIHKKKFTDKTNDSRKTQKRTQTHINRTDNTQTSKENKPHTETKNENNTV